MIWLRRLLRTIRREDDRDVDEELRLHLDMEADDLQARGLSPDDARRRAAIALGGTEQVKAEAREVRRGRWLTAFPNEVRWAWRGVRGRGYRSTLFVGLVAVPMAATAVVFSMTDAYVFRPVPYPRADRLVTFERHFEGIGRPIEGLDATETLAWRGQADLFAAIEGFNRGPSLFLTTAGITESVPSEQVTPGLFSMLGVVPQFGRAFSAEDSQPGRPAVVVISKDLARRLFGDPALAIGNPLQPSGDSPRVVGVMAAGFRFPNALVQVWQPLSTAVEVAGRPSFQSVIALLAPLASFESVVRGVAARRAVVAPSAHPDTLAVMNFVAARRDPRATLFVFLLGAAIALALVASLNIASLELAGALARGRIFAVQATLGASRASLVRSVLIETAILTATGAVVAIVLALEGVQTLAAYVPIAIANAALHPLDLDRQVIGVMIAAAILAWIVTSIPVVWRASRSDPATVLQHDQRSMTVSRSQSRIRHVLMAAQVAVTVLLVASASLFVRSYAARLAQDKGFDSTNLAAFQVLTPQMTAASQRDLDDTISARLQSSSSVAALTRSESLLPSMQATLATGLEIVGRPGNQGWVNLRGYVVEPRYFETLGIRLQEGRVFQPTDPPGSVVVDAAFARRFWPAGDALGATFHTHASFLKNGKNDSYYEFTIVGIAQHVRGDGVENPTGDGVFVLYGPFSPSSAPLTFLARLDDARHLGTVASLVRSVSPGSVVRAELVDERYERLYGDTRVAAAITASFGALAFVVAVAGVYGLMAFLVAGRAREMGIRISLGASAGEIRRLLIGPATVFASVGAVVGAVAALGASGWFASQLYGVSASDPATYLVTACAVVLTSLAAAWGPARWASGIDPAVTLRAD